MKKENGISQRYKEYLLSGEKITKVYNFRIGLYEILLTNKRVLLRRKFPRSIMAFNYSDVEVVEYTTKFKFFKLITSVFGFVFAVFFTQARENIFISALGWNNLVYVCSLASATIGLVYLGYFLLGAIGRLRIIVRYNSQPVEIYTRYSNYIPEFIRLVEGKKKK